MTVSGSEDDNDAGVDSIDCARSTGHVSRHEQDCEEANRYIDPPYREGWIERSA